MLAWGVVVNFTPQTGDATSKRLLSPQLLWNRQNVHAASVDLYTCSRQTKTPGNVTIGGP